MDTILIIDDDLISLRYITKLLTGTFDFIPAKTGEQALQIVSVRKPDLILLDIEMPGLNGFETLARLQQMPKLQKVPVIFLTADAEEATKTRALKAGAVDFITKPCEKMELLQRISTQLHSEAEHDRCSLLPE